MEKDLTSSELLRHCLSGRCDADWRLFYDRHNGMLRRILAAMLLRRIPKVDASDLDDAVQDLYFRLLRFGGKFKGSSDRELWSFLTRTAASVVVDSWRQYYQRGRWVLVTAGLLRTSEAMLEVRLWAWPPARRRAALQSHTHAPELWLIGGAEEILIAREEALARYFALPRRLRRRLWRKNSQLLA